MKKIKKLIKRIISKTKEYYYSQGTKNVRCNICNWEGRRFTGGGWHPYSTCPRCKSSIRHRLLKGAFSSEKFPISITGSNSKSILHFAPDPCLSQFFSSISDNYIKADYLAHGYEYGQLDMQLDISKMNSIEDESFEFLVALDVLEHVYDDKKALKEIYRVLKKDGVCILTVPQQDNLVETFEDPSVKNPKQREELFGQYDHLRIYGTDFAEMLENVGFQVHVIDENYFDSTLVKLHCLFPPILSKNPNATNYRKIYFGKKQQNI